MFKWFCTINILVGRPCLTSSKLIQFALNWRKEYRIRHQIMNIRSLMLDVWYETSDIRHLPSDFLTSDNKHQTPDIWHQTINFRCFTRHQTSAIRHLTLDSRFLKSDIWHQTRNIRCLPSDNKHQTSDIWHKTTNIWHLTSCTRHHTSHVKY